jgi:hypothetical protein
MNITESITERPNIFTIYLKYFINTCQGSLSNSLNFDLAGHVFRMGEARNACKIFEEKPFGGPRKKDIVIDNLPQLKDCEGVN